MTSPIKNRGYIITSSAAFLRKELGEDAAKAVFDKLTPPLPDLVTSAKAVEWYPVAMVSELNRAIGAAVGGTEEEKVKNAMVACGQFMAHEATNTFLRLLMRVLTPNLFARKLPDLWSRDCSAGRVTVDVTESRLVGTIAGIEGFDHAGPIALGFASFTLQQMGKNITKTSVHGWTLAKPGPDTIRFELDWKT